MPAQTARKLNIPSVYGGYAPIVNREVHLHRSLNNGCICRCKGCIVTGVQNLKGHGSGAVILAVK